MDYHIPLPLYQDIMNIIYSIYDINIIFEDNGLNRLSLQNLGDDMFNSELFSIESLDFDVEEDLYNGIVLNYRGNMQQKEVNKTWNGLKTNRKIKFDGWTPSGFVIITNKTMPSLLPRDSETMNMDEKQYLYGTVYNKIYCQKEFPLHFMIKYIVKSICSLVYS